jgi:hypothetical protein
MDAPGFYRRMAALPFVLPLVCGSLFVAFLPTDRQLSGLAGVLQDVLAAVALAGVWSAIPYTLYLVVVFAVWRPSTAQQLQRAVWFAPFIIGTGFAAAHGVGGYMMSGAEAILPLVMFWGLLAIGTGVGYAILIEITFWFATLFGFIPTGDGTVSRRSLTDALE